MVKNRPIRELVSIGKEKGQHRNIVLKIFNIITRDT